MLCVISVSKIVNNVLDKRGKNRWVIKYIETEFVKHQKRQKQRKISFFNVQSVPLTKNKAKAIGTFDNKQKSIHLHI